MQKVAFAIFSCCLFHADARSCNSEEQEVAVFDALTPIYLETLQVEDRSLVDLTIEKLYFGGYTNSCSEIYNVVKAVKGPQEIKRAMQSMVRTQMRLAHELDESVTSFIDKSFQILSSDSMKGKAAFAASTGAAAAALAREMVSNSDMRNAVRKALVAAGQAEKIVRMNEALTWAFQNIIKTPKWINSLCKGNACVEGLWRRIGQGKKLSQLAKMANVGLDATIVAKESVHAMYLWATGQISGERAVIKISMTLTGAVGASMGASTGVALGAMLGGAIDKLFVGEESEFGMAIGGAIGSLVGGAAGYFFLSSVTEQFLAAWMDVPADQRLEDAYRALKVNRSASNSEINRAFRKLALALHPDKRNPKDKEEADAFEKQFVELNVAMETIRQHRFGQLERSFSADDEKVEL